MPDLLSAAPSRQMLSQLDSMICEAMRNPRDERLWDAAGMLRARVLRDADAVALLSSWNISPNVDLDRLQPLLHRKLHS